MKNKKLTRRAAIKLAAETSLSLSLGPFNSFGENDPGKRSNENPIVLENKKKGTTDWQLTYIHSKDFRSEMIEGYCSHTSVRAGETIDVFLSAKLVTDVTIDFYRIGYYGGKGGRFMQQIGPIAVTPQPEPPIAEHRLRQCNWAVSTSFTIPDDWISGVYLGKLSCSGHRYESYIIFVVRDERKADLLFKTSDTTWHAYNKWPDNYSLYDSDEPEEPHSARTWVSFDRPYGKYPQVVDQPLSQGSGEFLLWEYPLCFWLEQHGYDVTYCGNIDIHDNPLGLKRIKCFLSVGHDEYWTLDMFNNVKKAVAGGLNAAFLSGNTIKWVIDMLPSADVTSFDVKSKLTHDGQRIPFKPDSKGRLFRTMHRLGRFGGLSEEEKARPNYAGPFPMEGPNEGTLMGARNPSVPTGSGDWVVTRQDHWIFEGTGMRNGDKIPGLVGWEHCGDPLDLPGLEVIASGLTINSGGKQSQSSATVYPGPKENWVFCAATIFWCIGLSQPPGLTPPYSHFGRPHGSDERVQRITANFFNKCGILHEKTFR